MNTNLGCTHTEINWSDTADVIVVGFGGAGAAAALAAAKEGASVLILEKAPRQDAGGNTAAAGGGMMAVDPTRKEAARVFFKKQVCASTTDEMIDGHIDEMSTTAQWLESMGIKTVVTEVGPGSSYREMEGAECMHTMVKMACRACGRKGCAGGSAMAKGCSGYGLFEALRDETEKYDCIKVAYEAPANRLVFDVETKEVLGVIAQINGESVALCARKGVVLALGGFENNADMLENYCNVAFPTFSTGTPYNTGDGLPMVMEVGAKLRGMQAVEWGCYASLKGSQEAQTSLGLDFGTPNAWNGVVLVNRDGQRFVNETAPVHKHQPGMMRPLHEKIQIPELAIKPETMEYANLPMYMIFDEKRRQEGALMTGAAAVSKTQWAPFHSEFVWSDDNSDEVERGWIIKADTLEQLAEKTGINAQNLTATVAQYNQACAEETADNMQRSLYMQPIQEGPFYALEACMSLINTQGGPVHDGKHRVIDHAGNPIKRLYSGGEFGSFYSRLYHGAGNLPEALGTRVAGTQAAQLDSWV